jgi:hypothetical protein
MKTQEEVAPLNMQVPERILVAGGNSHVAAKNLPRELQLESSVLSPSPEQTQMDAPPKSIRLDDQPFPSKEVLTTCEEITEFKWRIYNIDLKLEAIQSDNTSKLGLTLSDDCRITKKQ